ncbi:unnamed protein product [Chrysoparadoxa australica]
MLGAQQTMFAFIGACSLVVCRGFVMVTQPPATTSRGGFLKSSTAAIVSAAVLPSVAMPSFAEDTVAIKKLKTGRGPSPIAGDLVGIRFKGIYNGNVFDDITETPEPLYIRAGVGNIVKGMDDALLTMHVGDKWEITVPGPLAFGKEGRPPSPGKPRIPPNATVIYELELQTLPGKEDDLIESGAMDSFNEK